MKKWLCILLSAQLLTLSAFADEDDFMKNTQNDLILVGAAGAGGAVLGLSTLSFYDKPSKHVSNIWMGAAIGVIAGVIFVAYNSAQKESEDLVSKTPSEGFSTLERGEWHASNANSLSLPSVQFGTQFWQSSF